MCKNFMFFLITCSCFSLGLLAADSSSGGGITWLTNYERAVDQAKTSGKPMFLLFTGSDWCSWCIKLEDEALNTSEFAQTAGNSYVFVKLDFPLYSQQDPQVKEQNKQLQKKLSVRSFPTVILYDAQLNQQMGVTGYKPGGGKQYAKHLTDIVNEYSSYKQKMNALDSQKHSNADLKQLYEKAKELNFENDAHKVVKMGLQDDPTGYFLIERYRFLVNEGQGQEKEAVALRQRLLDSDPNNEQHVHYSVAIIDFEAACAKNNMPEATIAPLLHYIKKFGENDRDNLWRLQMIISQVYLDKNEMGQALHYAQCCYDTAPPGIQPEISKAVKNIQMQISTLQ